MFRKMEKREYRKKEIRNIKAFENLLIFYFLAFIASVTALENPTYTIGWKKCLARRETYVKGRVNTWAEREVFNWKVPATMIVLIGL